MLLPGGSVFLWELGIRGLVVTPRDPDAAGRVTLHAFGPFAGARVELLRDPGALGLMPEARGGFSVVLVRDRLRYLPSAGGPRLDAVFASEDHVTIGPQLAIGVSKELGFGIALAIAAGAEFTIAPVTTRIGLTLSLSAQAIP